MVGAEYDVEYSWKGLCSSAMDSLRLVLYAQSQGLNEEFMAALGWRHFGQDGELADRRVLLGAAEEAGLPRAGAREVLDSDRYSRELVETIAAAQEETILEAPGAAGAGAVMSAIPMLIFRTSSGKGKDFKEKLHGSLPQQEIEALLQRIEALK